MPDLSDVQVIIRTPYPGQAPQIVENQVTYPLTTTMLSVPGAKTVRGYSFFGDSFVYILFEDGTDPYWARSRVLEYLNQAQTRLPPRRQVCARSGCDRRRLDLRVRARRSQRRHESRAAARAAGLVSAYELKTLPNVAEVASIGGMVRQYQVVLDPDKLRAFACRMSQVSERAATSQSGSRRLGARAGRGRVHGARPRLSEVARRLPQRFRLTTIDAGVPVRLSDVARVQIGPEMRRGIAELDGEGEVAGGVIVMRSGKNALATIAAVKAQARRAQDEPAAGRRDRTDLRSLAADRARGRQPHATS